MVHGSVWDEANQHALKLTNDPGTVIQYNSNVNCRKLIFSETIMLCHDLLIPNHIITIHVYFDLDCVYVHPFDHPDVW